MCFGVRFAAVEVRRVLVPRSLSRALVYFAILEVEIFTSTETFLDLQ